MIHEAMGLAAALSAAADTGLLTSIIEQPGTAAHHAARRSLDPRATERLLDVLVAFGFAVRESASFAASPELLQWAAEAPTGIANTLALWGHVPTFVRTGEPFIKMDGAREAAYANVVGALGRMFASSATELATKLKRAPKRVLDIGCGSGVWSLAIAKQFPAAHVTGLDLPAVLEAFRTRAAEQGVADRIGTLPGDVHELAIPREFDLVVIANVLRIEAPERARHIVQRAAAALVPGGELLVIDALAGGTPEREQARAIYALHLTMRTQSGQVYSPAEVTRWMEHEHLANVTSIQLDAFPQGAVGALLGHAAS